MILERIMELQEELAKCNKEYLIDLVTKVGQFKQVRSLSFDNNETEIIEDIKNPSLYQVVEEIDLLVDGISSVFVYDTWEEFKITAITFDGCEEIIIIA